MSALQIVLAILCVGAVIAWHELGHYAVARLLGMRVLKYSIGFGPKLWGFRRGEIDYQIGAIPLGGFVLIKGMTTLDEDAVTDPRSFVNRPRWARWLVLAAGPAFNYGMAVVLFFIFFAAWPSPVDTNAIEVGGVKPATPAEVAGIQHGDMITAVDGAALEDVGDFKAKIGAKNGGPVSLTVWRDGQRSEMQLTPLMTEGGGFIVGIEPNLRYPAQGFGATVVNSFYATWVTTRQTLEALGALVQRKPGVDVGSPVQIVADIKDKIKKGGSFFVMIMALLSVNLGLFNLLPIPSLDGIKMLFLTVEGLFRRDLNAKFQLYVNAVGLLALFCLIGVLMVRDTVRLFG